MQTVDSVFAFPQYEAESYQNFKETVTVVLGSAFRFKYAENSNSWLLFGVAKQIVFVYTIVKGSAEETLFLTEKAFSDDYKPTWQQELVNNYLPVESADADTVFLVNKSGATLNDGDITVIGIGDREVVLTTIIADIGAIAFAAEQIDHNYTGRFRKLNGQLAVVNFKPGVLANDVTDLRKYVITSDMPGKATTSLSIIAGAVLGRIVANVSATSAKVILNPY